MTVKQTCGPVGGCGKARATSSSKLMVPGPTTCSRAFTRIWTVHGRERTRSTPFPESRILPPCGIGWRSEEHTSELQSLMRISYAVSCLKKKKKKLNNCQRQHTN